MKDEETVDFEQEGLLEGVEGDEARAARRELLEHLSEGGVSVEELRKAVAQDRLALLPAERVIAGEGRYTLTELAERADLEEEFLRSVLLSLGVPPPREGDRTASDRDLEAAATLKGLREVGLPDERILEVTRVIGQGMSASAEAVIDAVGEVFLKPGDTERDLGLRYADVAARLGPLTGPLLEAVWRLHVHHRVREGVVSHAERASGKLEGSREVAVGFADLVGFTRLGEKISAQEVGRLAGRLTDLAGEVADPPVRLVKTIGDAAMLASYDAHALLDAMDRLVASADDQEEDFPQLHAGLAFGPALPRAGDWYGKTVNLASRVADEARPGTVLVTSDVREQAGEGFAFSSLSARRLKGIKGSVRLYRARRASAGGEGSEP
ncbi:MAG: adenylate cyclase regulatory domain-containing protein [Thermoleophilaceae bacterium]